METYETVKKDLEDACVKGIVEGQYNIESKVAAFQRQAWYLEWLKET